LKNQGWNNYLFEYDHDGALWSFEIAARSEQEARERVNKLSNAKYLGEIQLTLPGRTGLLARLICRTRNFFERSRLTSINF